MEFRETLLAAQRNQQQKSSAGTYYKARFDPPKKENKPKDKLSANIQKFLAKKEEEERQKKLEAQKKREELHAMRDPKALRKIQKTLKVIKSANKSVLEDAVDRDNTAVTRDGPMQPDQDDYGYESQEAAAIYQKMMEKYSKIPDEPKFSLTTSKTKKDLNGTRERVKQALQHEDDPVPHKRRRKTEHEDREPSPVRQEPEKKKDDKPKFRKPAPPPMDFNQLLKLAEQKKSEPLELAPKKVPTEGEPERLMTKKQKREYEEEMARRMRQQERLKNGGKKSQEGSGVNKEKTSASEKKPEHSGMGRIPKIGDKSSGTPKAGAPKPSNDKGYKITLEKERIEKLQREKARLEKEKLERDKERTDIDRLEKLKAEREKIERDIERLNKDRERLEKSKLKLDAMSRSDKYVEKSKSRDEVKKIDLKSQNTYRIDKNSNEKKINGSKSAASDQNRAVPKDKVLPSKNGERPDNGKKMQESMKKSVDDRKSVPSNKGDVSGAKPKISNSFDFDKHVSSLKSGNGLKKPNGTRPGQPGEKRRLHPDDIRKKQMMKRRVVDSDEEYDSEMDDFIDDGEEDLDYSTHIKEIFGYDKSRYRDMDDDDDPSMESSFSRQMREEYVSKRIGIMEDLEDMRLEKQMKKKSNKRRISDD